MLNVCISYAQQNLMKIYFINKDPQNMFNICTRFFDNQFKGNYKLNVQKLSNTLCTQSVVFACMPL